MDVVEVLEGSLVYKGADQHTTLTRQQPTPVPEIIAPPVPAARRRRVLGLGARKGVVRS